jgi:hypothetical protein
MRSRFYPSTLAAAFVALLTPILAQDAPEVKVMRVDKFEFAPGIVTKKIEDRFQASAANVENRLKGVLLATLSQEISSTKLLTLAVRDESLKRLKEEWKVSEELGSGKSGDAATGPSVDDAHYLAYAKVEDFVADFSRLTSKKDPSLALTEWKLQVTISLEVTARKTGTKKVLKEEFEASGKGTNFLVNGKLPDRNAPDFDAVMVKQLADGVSKKLGMRVVDSLCPIRITSARGKLFNIDRGRAAGIKEGHIMELTERADDEFGTDSGFPIGQARVKTVKEDSSLMELLSDEGVEELKGDRTKLTVTRPVEAKFAEPEPKPAVASKTGSSKKSK